jgi:hypothetical protein
VLLAAAVLEARVETERLASAAQAALVDQSQ